MKIIVSRLELMAALLFASKDESRFTLASVCIEVNAKADAPTIIATDGRRLVVIQSQAFQGEDFGGFEESFQLLLRADFVKPVCALNRAIGGKMFPWITFEADAVSAEVQASFIGAHAVLNVESGAKVEGAFPDWRKCVPNKKAKRMPINDLGINSEYVGDFARASKALGLDDNVIQMNLVGQDSAVEVKLARAAYFYGLVMPCKTDAAVDYQPEFLNIVTDLPTTQSVVAQGESTVSTAEPPEGGTANEDDDGSVTIGAEGVAPLKISAKALKAMAVGLIAGHGRKRK